MSYKEMSIRDKERELHLQQIAPGDRLLKQTYTDVDDKEVPIYGDPDKQTVIMFSFIGCGGCEYAIRELQKVDFKIREGLQLYYSSRFDRKSTLKAYLQKKEFPYTGFSKESRMNEDLTTYFAPTFVFINPEGVVTDVITGLGEEAKEKILGEKL